MIKQFLSLAITLVSTKNMSSFIERFIEFYPPLLNSLKETGIMMFFSTLAALLFGLPLGTFIFLTTKDRPLENRLLNQILNMSVNIIRSFPFLLLVIISQPLIRVIYGRATGDPVAASFPLMLISIALYARF